MTGILSGLLGWKGYDCAWIAHIASDLPNLDIYSHNILIHLAPPRGIGFIFPPTLLFLVYPFVYLGQVFSWSEEFVSRVFSIPLFLFDIANVFLVVKIIIDNKKIKDVYINSIILILFFSGYFLYTTGYDCHPETLVIFFSLIGINLFFKRKIFLSSILLGLALSSKQIAVFIILPLLFYLIKRKTKFKIIVLFIAGIALSFISIILPFLINNFDDTYYGIYGFASNSART